MATCCPEGREDANCAPEGRAVLSPWSSEPPRPAPRAEQTAPAALTPTFPRQGPSPREQPRGGGGGGGHGRLREAVTSDRPARSTPAVSCEKASDPGSYGHTAQSTSSTQGCQACDPDSLCPLPQPPPRARLVSWCPCPSPDPAHLSPSPTSLKVSTRTQRPGEWRVGLAAVSRVHLRLAWPPWRACGRSSQP